MDGQDSPVALVTDFNTTSYTAAYDPWGVQVLTPVGTGGNGPSQTPYVFHSGIKDPGSGLVKFADPTGAAEPR